MTQDTSELSPAQQQVYDATLKALLNEQPQAMLSFFLNDVVYLHELSETAPKPPLRIDKAYLALYKWIQHIVHIEFETDADNDMPLRMLEYFGILYRRHKKPIISIIVCPFRTHIADAPLQIKSGDEILLDMQYRVIRLWTYDAKSYLARHQVHAYALLPTMQAATYEVLAQALDEMKEWYQGQTRRFSTHLLWFTTFLDRTDTIVPKEKERIRRKMADIESLLNENPYVLRKQAEGREEGREEGLVEGEAKGEAKGKALGLQSAIVTTVEFRYPALVNLAQKRVSTVNSLDALSLVFKGMLKAQDENEARLVLELLAA